MSTTNHNGFNGFRDRFHWPLDDHGRPQAYLCGHSLGLQPKSTRDLLLADLESWAQHGVAGHFSGPRPFADYAEIVNSLMAKLVGAAEPNVGMMNSLTANLHLLMASFYRPRGERNRIVIERGAFPSDRYAVATHLRWHGLDPDDCMVMLEDEPDSHTLSIDTLRDYLAREGERVALLLLPGVQYFSGQALDIKACTSAGHGVGALVGWDLAHAVGNTEVALDDSGCDFAAWCTYKYLNSGPGAVGGLYVNPRHGTDTHRLGGWWGHDRAARFKMPERFQPAPGAAGWALSNPPVMALGPVLASLRLFAEAGMANLRSRSLGLTTHLRDALAQQCGDHVQILTPKLAAQHGAQLSLRLRRSPDVARQVASALIEAGCICDWREPDVIRAAPAPLYNTGDDIDRFVNTLAKELRI